MDSTASTSDLQAMVRQAFARAAFVQDVGIEFVAAGTGWCEAGFKIEPRHLQHTGVVHAGAISTLADHCAGAAGQTQCQAGEWVLTAEFKINLLRPAQGDRLSCRAQVLKPGRSFHVVEAEVFAHQGEQRSLVAKLNATMAVVQR